LTTTCGFGIGSLDASSFPSYGAIASRMPSSRGSASETPLVGNKGSSLGISEFGKLRLGSGGAGLVDIHDVWITRGFLG
jgi:hypothetical protein